MKPHLSSLAAVLVVAVLGSTGTLSAANANEDKHPLFDKIDTNHDGFISLQEWITARHEYLSKRRAQGEEGGGGPNSTMNSLNHRQTSGAATASTGTPGSGHPRLQEEDESHHPLFDQIDTNHDGQISLAEWIAFRREHHGEHRRPGATPSAPGATAPDTPPTHPSSTLQ